jgi:hypothetical protein
MPALEEIVIGVNEGGTALCHFLLESRHLLPRRKINWANERSEVVPLFFGALTLLVRGSYQNEKPLEQLVIKDYAPMFVDDLCDEPLEELRNFVGILVTG